MSTSLIAITMTSLELVAFINSQRTDGEPELRHDNFMAKVPKVLGEGALKFKDTRVNPQNGQSYTIYRFPKREACLMAMSYSYELQAKVFDRMTALENHGAEPITAGEMMLAQCEMLLEQERRLTNLEDRVKVIEAIPKPKPKPFVDGSIDLHSKLCRGILWPHLFH